MHEPQATWNGSRIAVTSTLLPKILWQTASIDVFLDEECILKTGGQMKLTSSHSADFSHGGQEHKMTLTWGKASLRSFPVEIQIDGQSILSSRVYTRNWTLSLWPFIVVVVGIIYSEFK